MMIPLAGTSTGSAGKASPHLQAWLDEKKAAEEKRRQLEGDTSDDRKSVKARLKHIFRPVSYPKEEWEAEKQRGKSNP